VNIRVSIEIDAPPAMVWMAVEAIEDHVDWMADAESIQFTTPEHRGVGTTFDCETKVGPLRLVDKMRVTEWETARVMGIEHHAGTNRNRSHAVHVDGDAHLPRQDGWRGRRARSQARAHADLAS